MMSYFKSEILQPEYLDVITKTEHYQDPDKPNATHSIDVVDTWLLDDHRKSSVDKNIELP